MWHFYFNLGSNDDLPDQGMLKLADVLLNVSWRAGRVPTKSPESSLEPIHRGIHTCLFLKVSLTLLAWSKRAEALIYCRSAQGQQLRARSRMGVQPGA